MVFSLIEGDHCCSFKVNKNYGLLAVLVTSDGHAL